MSEQFTVNTGEAQSRVREKINVKNTVCVIMSDLPDEPSML